MYVLAGSGRAGPDGTPLSAGQLAVLGSGDHLRVVADRRQDGGGSLEVIVLGGRPIREPVAWYGPFVMNTRAEIQQAMEDYQAGRLGRAPAEKLAR